MPNFTVYDTGLRTKVRTGVGLSGFCPGECVSCNYVIITVCLVFIAVPSVVSCNIES